MEWKRHEGELEERGFEVSAERNMGEMLPTDCLLIIDVCGYECRPLSKTVRFNVLKVIPMGTTNSGAAKKAFKGV